MNFQITLAPTKEIASGRKIRLLAIVPHQILSVSTAMISPRKVQAAGTTASQMMLLRIELRNSRSPKAHS